jgi:hypothetical protein
MVDYYQDNDWGNEGFEEDENSSLWECNACGECQEIGGCKNSASNKKPLHLIAFDCITRAFHCIALLCLV